MPRLKRKQTEVREAILEWIEDAVFMEPAEVYDECILGIGERFGGVQAVAYDRSKCIKVMMRDSDGMTWEEAEEFFEFNTIGGWIGDRTPIFVTKVVSL